MSEALSIPLPLPQDGVWYLYAIECCNGSVYVGQTIDLPHRWKQHVTGKGGARWTKKHPPVRLFYFETIGSFKEAWHRERALKKSTSRNKLKKVLAVFDPEVVPAQIPRPVIVDEQKLPKKPSRKKVVKKAKIKSAIKSAKKIKKKKLAKKKALSSRNLN